MSDAKFRKGQSGNPGGRPKGLSRIVRETVGDIGWAEIVQEVRDIALGANEEAKPRDQIAAAAWLTDRGFGRPHQSVDVTSAGERVGSASVVVPMLPVGDMTAEQLADVRRTLIAAGARPDDGTRAQDDSDEEAAEEE